MSIKFNDTQLVLLSAASQRDDHCLVPPTDPKRSQAQRAVAKFLEAGLVKEIRAKAGAPIWRRDEGTGHTYALKLTAAGIKAIAVDETPPTQEEADRRADHPVGVADPQPEPGSNPAATVNRPDSGAAGIPMPPRGGTKIAQVIELLQRGDGANSCRACRCNGLAATHDAGGAHRLAQARVRNRDLSDRQAPRIGLSDRADRDDQR